MDWKECWVYWNIFILEAPLGGASKVFDHLANLHKAEELWVLGKPVMGC